ncbi:hypothetical protein GP486_006499, partial [Trichoglossum hirsutum]
MFWVTLQIFLTRASAQVDDGDWTFGQILPIVLLCNPLITIVEVFTESKKESDEKRERYDESGTEPEETKPQSAKRGDVPHDIEARSPIHEGNIPRSEARTALTIKVPEHEGSGVYQLGEQTDSTARNYYETEWMRAAVALALGQILAFTISLFVSLIRHLNLRFLIVVDCLVLFASQLCSTGALVMFG